MFTQESGQKGGHPMQNLGSTRATAHGAASVPAYALRPAGSDDYSFALALYVSGSAKHLKRIGRWDEARILRRFERTYELGDSQIIYVDGRIAGWMQVVEFAGQLYLRQLHLSDFARNR